MQTTACTRAKAAGVNVTHWSYHAGDVAHDGRTNLGTALDTRTDEQILDGLLRLGRWQRTRGGFAWAGYMGGGYRYWNRDIRDIRDTAAAGGLDERYRWPYAALGASLRQGLGRGRLTLDLRGLRPVGGDFKVDFGGVFDNARLDLDGETGGRIALAWEQPLHGGLTLRLASWYEHWELGRSDTGVLLRNGAAVGTVFEPASDTDSVGLSLGLGFGRLP